MDRTAAAALVLAPLLAIAACRGPTLSGDTVHDARGRSYRIGDLGGEWHEAHTGEGDVTFTHANGGTIFANHMCQGEIEDLSLDVLTNQLFLDIRVLDEERRPITIDGREGLRTHLLGELDGVPIELDAVVLKKDGCTYDMVLMAGREAFAERDRDFELFFRGFRKLS